VVAGVFDDGVEMKMRGLSGKRGWLSIVSKSRGFLWVGY
jgi:hypothetical protein